MKINRIVLLLFCLLPIVASAQFNMLFSSDYALPNTLINKVAEDSNHFIWVATEDGLCKFDGSRFTTYKSDEDNANALADNFVRTICTDNHGNVIVGTIMGIQLYRPLTDDFTPVVVAKQLKIGLNNVNNIQPLGNGDFLVMGNDVYTLHIDENHNPTILRNPLLGKMFNVYCGVKTADGLIWTCAKNKGLSVTNAAGKTTHVTDAQGRNYDFSGFCIAGDGSIYAGGMAYGLYIYNRARRNFDLVQGTESLERLCDVKTIPGTTLLCIACDGDGVRFYDYLTHRFTTYRQLDDPFVDISSQKAHSIVVGDDGSLWIGLYQRGLFLATQSSTPFSYVGQRSEALNLVGDRCVTSILQTHDGNMWVSTDNGGLYGFTSDLKPLRHFLVRETNFPANAQSLFEDSRHRVWFGSYGQGFGMVDTSTGHCTYVPLQGENSKELSVISFAEDKSGQIWAASMGKGVLHYDEQKHAMVTYLTDGPTPWSSAIYYDASSNRIYVGCYGGIVSFNPNDAKRKITTIESDVVVYSVSRVSSSTIAFSTNSGLVLVDTKTGKSRKITKKDGLPTNSIYACLPGKGGYLWISSTSGLTRVNVRNMDVESFTMRDGLQGNEFYKNAALVSRDGRLWFGGINGLTFFRTNDIVGQRLKCEVRVVAISADEKKVTRDEDGCYVLSKDNGCFTIELATNPLYLTHRVAYSYRLDGGNWQQLPLMDNRISLNNISYGHHVLYAKTTIDGHDTKVSETEIYIEFPWYLSWWAMILWLIIIGYAAYYAYRVMTRRRRMRNRALERRREEEIKEMKLQFFMNIVHDLRTPLTLIATPLQKLLGFGDDEEHQRLYSIMSRNSDRLIRLTDQIMDLRKIDMGKMNILCKPTEIGRLIRNITMSIEDMAIQRQQTISIISKQEEDINLWLDNDCFEKIYINLMSNAIKYTPEGGSISVEWGRMCPDDRFPDGAVSVSVTDTGIGITDEDKKNIFVRFFQVRQNDIHVKGTGIGLNLVSSLVRLHHGTIVVKDNPAGQGTRFTVFLPLGTSAFAQDELMTSTITETTSDVRDESEASASVSVAPQRQGKYRKTVLVVDDDDDIRNFLCEELCDMYNILESADGKDAFSIIVQKKVDIVVSDIMMPQVDGIELLQKIRNNPSLSHIPVILLTAKVSDRDRIEGLQMRADAYVTKPFNLELLMTMMDNLLRRNDSLRKSFSGASMPLAMIETPTLPESNVSDDSFMKKVIKCINDNIFNPDFTAEMMAAKLGLSRVQLYRKLKEQTNQSASNYIRNIRLTKSAELLHERKGTVSEIATSLGFKSLSHFSIAFKNLYGMTPTEYMKAGAE